MKRRPQTANPASPSGALLSSQRRFASTNDGAWAAARSCTGPRPNSAAAGRHSPGRNGGKLHVSSGAVGSSRAHSLTATTAFSLHGELLGGTARCSSAQGWIEGTAAHSSMRSAEGAADAGSAASSTGGGRAAREELLRVMKRAQEAMAASAHLHTRQNTHLPAASSSLASSTSAAASAAAAVAADAWASRGVVTAGRRKEGGQDGKGSRGGAGASSAAAEKDRWVGANCYRPQ